MPLKTEHLYNLNYRLFIVLASLWVLYFYVDFGFVLFSTFALKWSLPIPGVL